ncbi:uncharacterized protein LOC143860368 [Tasmannia lanceolata]|uniref:uncharacterized protein LOC143860368 n=1 Tax=Tasmannia lanceolata TaxID=3420 RepID=UPI0040645E5D
MDTARVMGIDGLKLENFDGSDFNAWCRKVIFGMQLLKIHYTVQEEKPDFEVLTLRKRRIGIQYQDEENLSKTHLIDKFLNMKFEDGKEVLPQVKELEKLVLKLEQKAIKLNNVFIARAIVNKLPPSWLSFSTKMRRRKKQVSLDDLKRFIRIEVEARTRSHIELLEKQKATDCRAPSKNKELNESINVVTGNEEISDFVAVISHVEGTSDSTDWWLDTGATCHVCTNKSLFSSYVASKEKVAMVGRSTTNVLGSGTVVLTLTSGKTVTLQNVKHVPSIAKNLVFGSLLCDAGMRLDFQGGKTVLSYNNVYFENAYRTDEMG